MYVPGTVLGFKKQRMEHVSLLPDSWAGKTRTGHEGRMCAGIGSSNLLRAFEKRSSTGKPVSGKMVLESGQRGELKTCPR